ncbi:MAG: winged helix-turn-helix transcriptional regulator [Firmicutes bacterium]|nr:winged helix-turn-helix transcriptional regulator [Bacillota bacterium]
MIQRFEKFSMAMTEINRYWHKIAADELEKYGLKGPYAVYLIVLMRYPEGITASQLCELSGRNKADVSRAVTDMEQKGLAQRVGPGYRALIFLTEEGTVAAENIRERAAKAVEHGGCGISDEERDVFYRALDRILANLKTISEEGLPSEE